MVKRRDFSEFRTAKNQNSKDIISQKLIKLALSSIARLAEIVFGPFFVEKLRMGGEGRLIMAISKCLNEKLFYC